MYFFIFMSKIKSWLSSLYCKARGILNISQVGGYFDFMSVSAENVTSHQYIAQNDRGLFGAISEMAGTFLLIWSKFI